MLLITIEFPELAWITFDVLAAAPSRRSIPLFPVSTFGWIVSVVGEVVVFAKMVLAMAFTVVPFRTKLFVLVLPPVSLLPIVILPEVDERDTAPAVCVLPFFRLIKTIPDGGLTPANEPMSADVGTPPVQLPAVFQSLLAVEFQVLVAAYVRPIDPAMKTTTAAKIAVRRNGSRRDIICWRTGTGDRGH